MDETYAKMWRAGHGSAGPALQDFYVLAEEETAPDQAWALAGPHNPVEFAHRLFALEALHPARPASRWQEQVEPYSLQWFLNIESHRHSRHGRWIPRLLEFAKHSGEILLGLGHGLGTDWLQYARHGADVIVCTPSTSQLQLIRRNFELRGLKGRFVHAQPMHLPLESASIDVACISSLVEGRDNIQAMVAEVYRILKPGGKVLAVTQARYDVHYWSSILLFWYRSLLSSKHRPKEKPSQRFSGAELRRLFDRFIDHRIHKRQLRRSEVPHIWRWLPLPVLARLMGRFLVLKAFKPLSAAMQVQAGAA